ncbi:hypothetical protein K504DRAFT_459731 [Pleomassaria siparia CBS 279.74]|uniref:Uncharacterized protein n=1 Tax=Pleomassaria siparia CBS 279.74 TaxID=1314801 RepID=A0A6G1K1M2_9PLEO|nr:hypothetical protein K504DRAFT_459731 [Pleomassaria siparia CBS 279.74]
MAPSSIKSNNQTEPLLSPNPSSSQVEPLTSTTSSAIKALSILRIITGASVLIAPIWTCGIFRLPIPASAGVVVRLVGARDIALGELLLTAEDKSSWTGGRREIKRALWTGIGTDAVDVCSLLVGVATGTLGRVPAALFGGGAALFLGLGAVGLRGL